MAKPARPTKAPSKLILDAAPEEDAGDADAVPVSVVPVSDEVPDADTSLFTAPRVLSDVPDAPDAVPVAVLFIEPDAADPVADAEAVIGMLMLPVIEPVMDPLGTADANASQTLEGTEEGAAYDWLAEERAAWQILLPASRAAGVITSVILNHESI